MQENGLVYLFSFQKYLNSAFARAIMHHPSVIAIEKKQSQLRLTGLPKLKLTFSVTSTTKNFCLSPTSIQLLTILGSSALILSSIGTGATFSPPAVIISSFSRPVIYKYPSASILAISPVRSQSSSPNASRVFSAPFR